MKWHFVSGSFLELERVRLVSIPTNTPACQTEARGSARRFFSIIAEVFTWCVRGASWYAALCGSRRCATGYSSVSGERGKKHCLSTIVYGEGASLRRFGYSLKRCPDTPACPPWATPHTFPLRKAIASSGECLSVVDLRLVRPRYPVLEAFWPWLILVSSLLGRLPVFFCFGLQLQVVLLTIEPCPYIDRGIYTMFCFCPLCPTKRYPEKKTY